jgi:hypothetical protein
MLRKDRVDPGDIGRKCGTGISRRVRGPGGYRPAGAPAAEDGDMTPVAPPEIDHSRKADALPQVFAAIR